MGTVYAVGVGPGSPNYVTEIVKKIILDSDFVVGYKYTLNIISDLIQNKEVYEITMDSQEKIYQKINHELGDRVLVVPFTGDVNFSESEVVDRLIEIFGDVEIIPGISSIQVAASKAKTPLDKSKTITMHITTSIEDKKIEVQKALIDGYNVILVPRPWPKDTSKMKVQVFEALTTENEICFDGMVNQLEGKEFSDLSVVVFNQVTLESYINFE
jgi:cobalt-precorrin-7 (C5)-methyltransferase